MSGMKRLAQRLLASLATLVVLAGCGGDTLELSGQLVLDAPLLGGADYIVRDGARCEGAGPFADVSNAAVVTVRGPDGSVVGVTEVGWGAPHDVLPRCVFEWSVSVPELDFYTVEVAGRGEVTRSRDQVESDGGRIDLSIGSG